MEVLKNHCAGQIAEVSDGPTEIHRDVWDESYSVRDDDNCLTIHVQI